MPDFLERVAILLDSGQNFGHPLKAAEVNDDEFSLEGDIRTMKG